MTTKTMTNDPERTMKLLLVEDQENSRLVLEQAIAAVLPKYIPGFGSKEARGYDVAKYYRQAEQMIQQNRYDLVLLDHRLPEQDSGFRDIDDPERFSQLLDEAEERIIGGYGLIPLIREKNPVAIIIGTSTLRYGLERFPQPDYLINKLEAERELERIMRRIADRKKEEIGV